MTDRRPLVLDSTGKRLEMPAGDFVADTPLSWRNRVINGGMAIDQRNAGAAVTADASYPVDRFKTYIYGTGSAQRTAFGNPPAVAGFTHYVRFIRTAGGSFESLFIQRFENVKALSGATMTFSFWVRGDVIPAAGFSVVANAWTDSVSSLGDSPQTNTAFAITSTWTRISMRLDVPTISSDPGAGGGYFQIYFKCLSTSQNFSIDTTGWQWEPGTVATAFEFRPHEIEMALCQRFRCQSASFPGVGITGGGAAVFVANGSSYAIGGVRFPVPMRAVPTLVIYDNAGTSGAVYNTATGNVTGVTADYIGVDGWQMINKTSGWSAGQVLMATFTATAEL